MLPLCVLESWYPEDPERALLFADWITVIHFAVVLFVIFSEVFILAGRPLRWHWVGNRWFRGIHLGIIIYVSVTTLTGKLCFLTTWENELRAIGGAPIEQSGFIAYWAHELLFIEGDLTSFAIAYVIFCAAVIASLFITPVRWRGSPKGT